MTAGLPEVSFHDAEVLALRLDREGPTLELDVETFAQLPEARIVRLRFDGVSNLDIGGVNEQNVLFDLRAERQTDNSFSVTLESSYGLSGAFRCTGIMTLPEPTSGDIP